MCGRFGMALSGDLLAKLVGVEDAPDLPPRFNIAPTQDVLVVKPGRGGARRFAQMKWGLVPFFAKDDKGAAKLINARSETAADKPMFRWAFRQRRCLIPADGFYEWKKLATDRQPYHFGMPGGAGFCMAGLWERWQSEDGRVVTSCSILTVPANALVAPIHDRMPAILGHDAYTVWLDTQLQDRTRLEALLEPYPADQMVSWPVSKRVSSYMNDDEQCRRPSGQLSLF